MKIILTTILSFLLVNGVVAQSFERTVIGLSGTELSTTGEPVIGTISNGEITLTQGFQQPVAKKTVSTLPVISGLNINIFPNPTFGHLSIRVNDANLYTLRMTDQTGREVLTAQSLIAQADYDLYHLADGLYFVIITDEAGQIVETKKFIKTK